MVEAIKLLAVWAYPLGLSLLASIGAAGLLCVRRTRSGLALLAVGAGWLWFWSMPVTADWLLGSLERDWPYREAALAPTAGAIVVLGGAFNSGRGQWPYPDATGSIDRYWHAARLFHAERAPLVIVSGGPLRPTRLAPSEAESGARLLADLGVPTAAIVIEAQARTTRENALRVGERLAAANTRESFLLVTSARHMARSLATFRAVGLDPVPIATDFTVTPDPAFHIRRFLPSASALGRSTAAFHEYLGRGFYELAGWA